MTFYSGFQFLDSILSYTAEMHFFVFLFLNLSYEVEHLYTSAEFWKDVASLLHPVSKFCFLLHETILRHVPDELQSPYQQEMMDGGWRWCNYQSDQNYMKGEWTLLLPVKNMYFIHGIYNSSNYDWVSHSYILIS